MTASGRAARLLCTAAVVCAPLLARAAEPPAASVEEVTVRAPRPARDPVDLRVSAEEAGGAAGTAGDPVKVVQDLPGVARPSFDSGQLVVWGAAPEDTRVTVDGVEIPQLFHGSALRATVSGDLVRDVTLTPGAYGVDGGRAIGGILRVETRDLPESGLHGVAAVDTLDGSALVSATAGDRVRFAAAGRYGWLDAVLRAALAPDVGDFFAVPRYRDCQAKAQIDLRSEGSLDAVVLGSGDDLTRVIPDADPNRVRTEDRSSAFQRAYLRYRRRLDDGGAIDVVPWIGQDTSHVDLRFGAIPAQLHEDALRWGLRASHRSRVAAPITLALGLDVDGTYAREHRAGSMTIPAREGDVTYFGQPPGGDTNADDWTATIIDVGPNAQVSVDLGALALDAGVRFDAYLLEPSRQTPRVGQTPPVGLSHLEGELEPRASARLRVTPRFSVMAAAGVYSQPPAASDLSAVFGNPALGPERAEHLVAGESLAITRTLSAEVTAFYRSLHDLAVRDPSPTPKLAQALLQEGSGESYGLQVLVRQRPWRGFSGWVAYTLSRSQRRAAPGAALRLFDDDQPHVLTVVASREVGAWRVSARFRFASGLARTPVVGALYDARDDAFQPIFGAQNTLRLPDFWQLDARVDRSVPLGRSARLVLSLEGLNVTDHANAEEYAYSADLRSRSVITGLPIVAVLGARVEL